MKKKIKVYILILILTLGLSFSYDSIVQKVHASSNSSSSSSYEFSFLPAGATKTYLKNGVYKYNHRGVYGLCDKEGFITSSHFDEIRELGDYLLVKIHNQYGLMDYYGRYMIQPYWDYISEAKSKYFYVESNGLKGVVDKYGNILLPVSWEDVVMISVKEFFVKDDSLWGAVDSGQNIIVPIEWDAVNTLGNLYKVKKNGLYGVVYPGGKTFLETKYSYLESFYNNSLISICNTTTGCGILTMENKSYLPLIHEGIFSYLNEYNFKFTLNERVGVVDLMGRKIANPIYDLLTKEDENIAFTKKGKTYGIISLHEHREIVPPIYTKIEKTNYKGFYKIKINGDWGVIGYDGQKVFECDNGPFEINRKLKKYENLKRYESTFAHNSYNNKLKKAYYYIQIEGPNSLNAKSFLREILNSESKNNDLKIEAQNLIDKYKINISY